MGGAGHEGGFTHCGKTQQVLRSCKGNMKLTIKPLTPELADDYFDFFENRAFTDDSPYRCYCQMYQMSKEQVKTAFDHADGLDGGQVSRKVAEQQIASGALQGYLAFIDSMAIGWCNVNDRANFPVEPCTDTYFYAPPEKREKAVVCFEVAPEYRGKGIATALLQRAISDAKAEGYIAVTAFPVVRSERYEWDCAGPVHLYQKEGFIEISELDASVVMRKEFC